jgi:hypothetical protein
LRGIDLPQDPVPGKCPVRLEERDAVDEHRDRGQASNDFSVDPFAIGVGTLLASAMKINAVQASDGDGEYKLEESQDESDDSTDHASAARAVAHKVESTHVVEVV